MAILRVQKTENYSVVSNEILNDKKLSWKAKGILVYLLSKPNDWQVYLNNLAEQSIDGRDKTASGIKELISIGYIVRKKIRNEKGKYEGYEYIINEKPELEKPETGNPISENPTLLSTDTNQVLNKLNTDIHDDFVTEKEKNDDRDDLSQRYILYPDVDRIYNLYPSQCPVKKDRSTGKCFKNKSQIERLIQKGIQPDKIIKTINWYVSNCVKTKTYIKNFSTFLNNLPDIPEEKINKIKISINEPEEDYEVSPEQMARTGKRLKELVKEMEAWEKAS